MPRKKLKKVFIGYAHRDESKIRQELYERLRALDLNVWLDDAPIKPGEKLKDAIESAINRASFITTNYDTLLDDALSKGMPDLNLPDQVEKASELALPPPKTIQVIDSVANVRELSVELISYLKNHKSELDKLRWDVFEHLVAEFLASHGFEDIALVARDPITSADIFAVHKIIPTGEKVRFFVEVKHTDDKAGIEVINEVFGAYTMERPKFGWDVAMIVSLAGFTNPRKISTDKVSLIGVRLKDRDDVESWLDGYSPTESGLWLPKPQTSMPWPKEPG